MTKQDMIDQIVNTFIVNMADPSIKDGFSYYSKDVNGFGNIVGSLYADNVIPNDDTYIDTLEELVTKYPSVLEKYPNLLDYSKLIDGLDFWHDTQIDGASQVDRVISLAGCVTTYSPEDIYTLREVLNKHDLLDVEEVANV